jgi:flagellar basal body rod protein FlgG
MAYAVLNSPRMNVSLYQAAAAMNAQARWQEMITNNLSSGAAPGYRKQDVSFSAVQAGIDPTALNRTGQRYWIPSATAATNFNPGELRATGNPLDCAIEGSGFFEVQLPDGSRAYTRDGEFHLSAQGQLVTKLGYNVLSDGGPVQLDPNNPAPITISATGEVSQSDQVKGRIRLVEFSQPQSLTSIAGGYFRADPAVAQPISSTASSVRQGFLEASNASPTAEMASLITSMRLFEANQKVLQTQDDRMGRAIADLSGTS